jgi:hypothetical protein
MTGTTAQPVSITALLMVLLVRRSPVRPRKRLCQRICRW